MNVKKLATGLMVGALAITSIFALGTTSTSKAAEDEGTPMYRLYNPGNGEHLYTKDSGEKDVLLEKGWNYEGYSWIAASEGEPVYRLFNPYSGEHHYTMNEDERFWLLLSGWNNEGIGWYSRTEGSECEAPVYRLFCPFTTEGLKAHHYTMDESEKNWLVSIGWRYEGEAWTSLHSIETTGTIPATCSTEGYSGGAKCKVCDKTYEGSTLPLNRMNHIHTTFVPEETKVIQRGSPWGSMYAIYSCNYCGTDYYKDGDPLDSTAAFVKHLIENHGMYPVGYTTFKEWYEDWHSKNLTVHDKAYDAISQGLVVEPAPSYETHFSVRREPNCEDIVTIPAHYHCEDCWEDMYIL